MTPTPRRLIVGISGASGIVYGLRLLEILRSVEIETHVVVSNAAKVTLALETDRKLADLQALADVWYQTNDIGAAISSGSFRTEGMIVCPCSMRTLAEIANGITGSLLPRAADVVLKERRRLVLVARETPLHLGHIRNMAAVTEMGAIVYPPVPAMYARPASIDEMIDHTVGRVLDLFGIDAGVVRRWREAPDEPGGEPNGV
ncbi:UbiX family flavin prenyltransferase [Rhodoplanes sp. TEM]|uniref:Flavin prenyltransferase UbiX n=1 Tax=Rhodoplanes tepidamans TaxID=200616 RepID=A0ABT5J9P2_RHOTP|nr:MULTISPECIES: UbiX family flavin prenyltransferase [Rhodoplanes]MDC7786228.1 UbiX family flavin prenyltransferase [Rhodoplanes tepidamans]MDC7982401.1 UbiX family flavin prenyltransferase [Rhodoplanes sp. TEM]MDQ0355027.1 4-hydroxy-3-polyprenylbenzoate decarboxylase [Rhodoplanes tepidamans]